MQDFFTCEPGYEEQAHDVAFARCRKLVKDMHYEAQVQCVINYSASIRGVKMIKREARTYRLTREQYLEVSVPDFIRLSASSNSLR